MVNKFGDDTSLEIGSDIQLVKKVIYNYGKFSDYCSQIMSTYRLGFTPHRLLKKVIAIPIYTYGTKVFSHGSKCSATDDHLKHLDWGHHGQICATEIITDKVLSADDCLVTFGPGDFDDAGNESGNILAIRGEQGISGLEGEQGPIGQKGERGLVGPAGESIDYGQVGILVAKMIPSIFQPEKIIEKLRNEDSICWFRILNKHSDLQMKDKDKVWIWLNNSSNHKNAQSYREDDLSTMAQCSNDEEKFLGKRWFLKLSEDQYNVNQTIMPNCCIFFVYRLKPTSRNNIRFLLGCSSKNLEKPKQHAIGFDLMGLNIADGRGKLTRFTNFPRTNPVSIGEWHVLCVEWCPQERDSDIKNSSVWVNAKKVATFANSIAKSSEHFTIGGMKILDNNSFLNVDIAHFEIYNSRLDDYKKYFLQKNLCSLYNIQADDRTSHGDCI